MAVVLYSLSSLIPKVWGNNVAVYTWTGLGPGDTGQPINGPGFADTSYQISGFVGHTVVIEGSNDGTNYITLVDPFNQALSFTSAALAQVLPIALWIRPRVSGGAGALISVIAVHCNHSPN